MSATDAVALFRARELSLVELMRAVIDRAEKTEPVVNAFAERLFDEALSQARDAEARVGPLTRDAVSVGAEGVELVDELIDNIPRPVVLQEKSVQATLTCLRNAHRRRFKIHRAVRVQDEVE